VSDDESCTSGEVRSTEDLVLVPDSLPFHDARIKYLIAKGKKMEGTQWKRKRKERIGEKGLVSLSLGVSLIPVRQAFVDEGERKEEERSKLINFLLMYRRGLNK
jgi:hypothetical protein